MKKFFTFLLCLALVAVFALNGEKIRDGINGFIDTVFISELDKITDEKIELGSKYKNHFDTLSSIQKRGYNQILTKVLTAEDSFPSTIEVPMMTSEELTQTFQAVLYDNPAVVAIGRDNRILTSDNLCYFQPNYIMSVNEQKEMNSKLEQAINKIIAEIPQDATEFEKELYIHDYIVNFCTYDNKASQSSSTAYSCIVDGFSACEGYSKANKMLLEKVGIECYTISGDATDVNGKTQGHMWNVVKIDGKYYHSDVTWDDPISQDGAQSLSHLFMNVTQKEISIDHSNFTCPFVCDSEDANYFVKTQKVITSLGNDQLNRLKQIISQSDGKSTEIKFADREIYRKAVKSFIDNGKIYDIIKSVNRKYYKKLNTKSIRYIEDEDRLVLNLFFD